MAHKAKPRIEPLVPLSLHGLHSTFPIVIEAFPRFVAILPLLHEFAENGGRAELLLLKLAVQVLKDCPIGIQSGLIADFEGSVSAQAEAE